MDDRKGNRGSFDSADHDETVIGCGQDHTSLEIKRVRPEYVNIA